MYQEYQSQGFTPIAVNLWESVDLVKAYARQASHPYLIDNGGVWGVYRQTGGIPLNYVVDAQGIIRYIAEGFNENAMRAVIEQYLPGQLDHDVGVSKLIAPSGTADSGATFTPACSVYNYGLNTETYDVRMKIGTGYNETFTVTGHASNSAMYVEFPQWTAEERGLLNVKCSTGLATDQVPFNDYQTGTVTINVFDLQVMYILAPAGDVDSGTVVVPAAVVANNGTMADMARVKLTVSDGYIDSTSTPLQPGVVDTTYFSDWTALQLGTFAVRCTVGGIRGDLIPANNLLVGEVRVTTSGISEQGELPGRAERPATVVRDVLFVPTPEGRRLSAVLFDVNGREVMDVFPGANPVSHLSPGVYYLRVEDETEVGKLVIQQ